MHVLEALSHELPATHGLFNISIDVGWIALDIVDVLLCGGRNLACVLELIFVLLKERHYFLKVANRPIGYIVG
jgi:hypothetical protein